MLQASRLVLIDALLDKGDNLFRTLFLVLTGSLLYVVGKNTGSILSGTDDTSDTCCASDWCRIRLANGVCCPSIPC